MKRTIGIKKSYLLKYLSLLIFFFISIHIYASNSTPSLKHESDSIREALKKCQDDTCKYKLLYPLIWKYAASDLKISKYYGNWAFDELKNMTISSQLIDVYSIKGNIFFNECRFDSAYACFQKSLAMSKALHYNLGWAYFKVALAEDYLLSFRTALMNLKNSERYFTSANNTGMVLSLFTRIYGNLGKTDSALMYFDKQLDLCRKNSDKKGEVSVFTSIADFYRNNGNIIKSLESLNYALKLAESINDEDAISSIYASIGDIFIEKKMNFSIAHEYFKEGLEKSINSKNNYQMFRIRMKIGKLFLTEGKDSISLVYNLKCLAIAKEIGDQTHFVHLYKNLGYSYEKLNDYKHAYYYFKKCYESNCKCCNRLYHHEAHLELADICLKLNYPDEALFYYQKSLELAKCFNARKEIASSNLRLGNFYMLMNRGKIAENYYLSAYKTVYGTNYFLLRKNITDTLSRFYLKQNDLKRAYAYLTISRIMGDSLSRTEKEFSLADLEMRFNFEKIKNDSKAKQALSTVEIKRQKVYRNSLFAILILIIGLSFVIYKSYRRKKTDNKLLTKKNNEIEEKNHEIQSQLEEIERISAKLHEADQMKLRFFTNISHELRTPLTLIISPLVKLLKGNNREDKEGMYSVMLRNSRKLQQLINQLLDISKIDKSELKLNLKLFNFNKQVRLVALMFQSIAEEKNILFKIIEKEKKMVFCFDAERIEQVLNNLLSNAFKFTPGGGKIEITITKEENNAIVKVRDNGIGIPPESLDKVFDRFYQADSTVSRNFEGSGIGLALAKELVVLHKGQISVKSDPDCYREGKWTEFQVAIPIVKSDDITIEETQFTINPVDEWATFQTEGNKNNSKRKESILVVEDNIDLRSYISESLSHKYQVSEAKNGTEGIDLAMKNVPDIIISDVMMPETDGYQLTSAIKNNFRTSHIPVILLTAKADRDSKIVGLQKGADDYISKPFDEDELMLRIENILQNRKRLQEKYRKQITVNPSEVEVKSFDEQFLLKLAGIIEQEISNPALNVDFLSQKIGLSRPQLFRKLKALTDLSINQFIRSTRLKRAAQLLKKKSATISEIAFNTGFDNLSYFTKRFKEEFGKLPSEY